MQTCRHDEADVCILPCLNIVFVFLSGGHCCWHSRKNGRLDFCWTPVTDSVSFLCTWWGWWITETGIHWTHW